MFPLYIHTVKYSINFTMCTLLLDDGHRLMEPEKHIKFTVFVIDLLEYYLLFIRMVTACIYTTSVILQITLQN